MIIPVGNPSPREPEGKHRLQRGIRMPGFGRVGGTRGEYTAAAILARNGRQVSGEDEHEAVAR